MTKVTGKNHYEQAFENWLIDKRIKYVQVDQTKRAIFKRAKIKSFDFVISADNGQMLMIEVKGRKFKASNLNKTSAMQSWVTMDDVDGLDQWQKILGNQYKAMFVFAYEFESPDIDSAGTEIFEFNDRRYSFFMVELQDYKEHMVLRSPKWKTVAMLTDDYKKCAKKAQDVLI